MMPHTVPKRPMNGVALAVVARNGRYRSSRAISSADARRIARCTASSRSPLEPVLVVVEHVVHDLGDAGHFLVRGDVELRQRALAQLLRGREHDGRAPPLAISAQEGHGVAADAPHLPPLVDDERPAHDREQHRAERAPPSRRARPAGRDRERCYRGRQRWATRSSFLFSHDSEATALGVSIFSLENQDLR